MSKENTPAPLATLTTGRPWPVTTAFTLLFLAISGGSWWFMRQEPAAAGVFDAHLSEVRARAFPNGIPLKSEWTGNGIADWLLTELVAAFIGGAAGWDNNVRLQQSYLLVNFVVVVGLLSAEAGRVKNRWRVLSFTSIWAVLYQLVGGAVICPLYFIAYIWASAGKPYFTTGREIPLSYAKALLPALLFGYLVPTIVMYIPYPDISTTQYMIVFWQFAPILVNIILFLSSALSSSPGNTRTPGATSLASSGPPRDIQPLKRLYRVLFLVSVLVHAGTAIALFNNPGQQQQQLSFDHAFLPSWERRALNSIQALHWVFQWDLYGIFGSGLLWCLVELCDLRRLLGADEVAGSLSALVLVAAGAVALGPGAAVAAVLYWREEKLVLVENRLKKTTAERAKVA